MHVTAFAKPGARLSGFTRRGTHTLKRGSLCVPQRRVFQRLWELDATTPGPTLGATKANHEATIALRPCGRGRLESQLPVRMVRPRSPMFGLGYPYQAEFRCSYPSRFEHIPRSHSTPP